MALTLDGNSPFEYGPSTADPVFKIVEAHVSPSQVCQRFLNLEGRDVQKGLDAQQQGNYPAACADFQASICVFSLDKIRQQRGIYGKPVSLFLLTNKDTAVIKGILRLILSLLRVGFFHL